MKTFYTIMALLFSTTAFAAEVNNVIKFEKHKNFSRMAA
jgi:hypothetical protein